MTPPDTRAVLLDLIEKAKTVNTFTHGEDHIAHRWMSVDADVLLPLLALALKGLEYQEAEQSIDESLDIVFGPKEQP
jgi:hypothetical protein